jgi:hypothetical protein
LQPGGHLDDHIAAASATDLWLGYLSLGGNEAFDFFDVASLPTADLKVIFAIVAAWRGRTIADAMPFFSKVNLERTAGDLLNRGFKISLAKVDYASARK